MVVTQEEIAKFIELNTQGLRNHCTVIRYLGKMGVKINYKRKKADPRGYVFMQPLGPGCRGIELRVN